MRDQIQSKYAAVGRKLLSSLAITFIAGSQILTISPASSPGGIVSPGQGSWYWFEDCHDGKMMGLELLMDGKTVYQLKFRVCLIDHSGAKSESELEIKAFYISGGHTFQDTYHTRKGDKIEGNIWQAGAEPDALWIGLSFSTKNQVLLNTLHVVKPGKPSQSQLDRGIVVRTYPLK